MWKETKIYKALANSNSEQVNKMRNVLENPQVMEKIQVILNKSGTTPKDFTLHDSSHSFRVAERMWDLIPDKTKEILSAFELGFLLLSAYLHDIGMNPRFSKVQSHLLFLTTNSKDQLTEEEIQEFQKWIDDNLKSQTIDITKETINDLDSTNYILTYYVRFKHNDWSEEWIKENLLSETLSLYPRWIEDIISVCKSHHYDMDSLLETDFDPKYVQSSNIHLRYLAICLRVADVMENDPERTPDILLNYRDIAETSRKYWLKDHEFQLIRKEDKFTIYSRPDRAFIHKAIIETAEQIEAELKLCRRLVIERPLNYSSYGLVQNYEWIINAILERDIEPLKGTYKYIEGAFRPNTDRILELLGGNQLYGDPIWAFRELLQNSFDAVKEKIAYLVLDQVNDPNETIKQFANINWIKVNLERRDDGFWLVCQDSGVGMTDDIIEKFFLVSGASRKYELIGLERKCKAKGFNMGRTGQFGIGVLSYFMIAEKIIFKTKRVQQTGYDDSKITGWKFEINGTHDFGELRKINWSYTGSEIEIKLRKPFNADIEKWDRSFSQFVINSISKVPCTLTYHSCLSNTNNHQIGYSWAQSNDDFIRKVALLFKGRMLDKKENFNYEFVNNNQRQLDKEELELTRKALSDLKNRTKCLSEEGRLLDNLGSYKVNIPYFELLYGNCFYYMYESNEDNNHFVYQLGQGHYWSPFFDTIALSLQGFKIAPHTREDKLKNLLRTNHKNVFVQVDFEIIKEENLSVSRHHLTIERDFIKIINFLNERIEKLIENNCALFDNTYDSVNNRMTKREIKNDFWLHYEDPLSLPPYGPLRKDLLKRALWAKVTYPFFTSGPPICLLLDYCKSKLSPLPALSSFIGRYESNMFDPAYDFFQFFRLGFHKNSFNKYEEVEFYPIVLLPNSSKGLLSSKALKQIDFPNAMESFLFLKKDSIVPSKLFTVFVNSAFLGHVSLDNYVEIEFGKKHVQNVDVSSLSTYEDSLFFLINYFISKNDSWWDALCENRQDLVSHLFRKLGITEFFILDCMHSNHQQILKVTPTNLLSYSLFDFNFESKLSDTSFEITTSITQ